MSHLHPIFMASSSFNRLEAPLRASCMYLPHASLNLNDFQPFQIVKHAAYLFRLSAHQQFQLTDRALPVNKQIQAAIRACKSGALNAPVGLREIYAAAWNLAVCPRERFRL